MPATATADAEASATNGVYRIHTGGSTWGRVLDVTNASPNANPRGSWGVWPLSPDNPESADMPPEARRRATVPPATRVSIP